MPSFFIIFPAYFYLLPNLAMAPNFEEVAKSLQESAKLCYFIILNILRNLIFAGKFLSLSIESQMNLALPTT